MNLEILLGLAMGILLLLVAVSIVLIAWEKPDPPGDEKETSTPPHRSGKK